MEELREINIPAGVREIGEAAFAACAALRTLTIPPNVKRIGKKAFLGCAALETVYISEGVEELGAGVFAKCSKLRKVYMPAFSSCKKCLALTPSKPVTNPPNPTAIFGTKRKTVWILNYLRRVQM